MFVWRSRNYILLACLTKNIVIVRRCVQVTVNQDKTSKQIAAMRVEIMQLQEELNEYKSVSRESPRFSYFVAQL